MLKELSMEQIEAIFEALPIDLMFIDENEKMRYYNKAYKEPRKQLANVFGKDIRACHKKESLSRFETFISNLKNGKKDEENFWVSYNDRLLNRFIAVRSKDGKYLGVVEYVEKFKKLEELARKNEDAYRVLP